jgi:hypothetical protein
MEVDNLFGRPGTETITAELCAELSRLQLAVRDAPHPD